MEWYHQQTKWSEGHNYDDPDVSTVELREWFLEMITLYPAMNGPHASGDVDEPKVTDYSVGRSVIYAAFAWPEAAAARGIMFSLAKKHRVGFFDVSAGDGGVWVPNRDGGYTCIHGESSQ